jgi:hypothetical protein
VLLCHCLDNVAVRLLDFVIGHRVQDGHKQTHNKGVFFSIHTYATTKTVCQAADVTTMGLLTTLAT